VAGGMNLLQREKERLRELHKMEMFGANKDDSKKVWAISNLFSLLVLVNDTQFFVSDNRPQNAQLTSFDIRIVTLYICMNFLQI
jgi:hypothetical protein